MPARPPHRTETVISACDVPVRVQELLDDGRRLALIAAHHDDDGTPGGRAVRVVYLFVSGPPDTRTELHIRLDPDNPQLPTIAHLSFPGGRFEREMADLHGITLLDHPMPRRLVRHFHWPRGWYPMRPDAGPPRPSPNRKAPIPSSKSRARACTRSPSARCTPE